MSGIFTLRMARAIRAGAPLCLLASIDHPDGTFRCWSGIGELEYSDYTWTGIGNLGRVGPVKKMAELGIQEVTFALSGVDEQTVALLSDVVRNRSGMVWLAALDERGRIIADPYELLDTQLDYQSFQASGDGMATVIITARSGFYTLERVVDDCWTDEDQKKRFPDTDDGGDTGCALIASLQNQEITGWLP